MNPFGRSPLYGGCSYPSFEETIPYYRVGPSPRTLRRALSELPLNEKYDAYLAWFHAWVIRLEDWREAREGYQVTITERGLWVVDQWCGDVEEALGVIWDRAWRYYWDEEGYRLSNPAHEPIHVFSGGEGGLEYGEPREGQEADLLYRRRCRIFT